MVSELSISLKDSEKTLKQKFLVYNEYKVDREDPIIKGYIEQMLKDWVGLPPETIKVKINLLIE